MNVIRVTLGLVLLAAQPVAGVAATVEALEGDVMINTGEGFKRLTGRVTVNPGDHVMVAPGSKATVTYANGSVPVEPGLVYAVLEQAPVIPQQWPAEISEGDGGEAASTAAANAITEASAGGVFAGTNGMVLGAVGVAAAVGGVAALASSSGSSSGSAPASP
jgi:hypothetical protein